MCVSDFVRVCVFFLRRARGPRISARKRSLAEHIREEEIRKRHEEREKLDAELPGQDTPLVQPHNGVDQLFAECDRDANHTHSVQH